MLARLLTLFGLRKRACTCLAWERTHPCLKRYGKYDCRAVMAKWPPRAERQAPHDGAVLRAWMDSKGYDE